MQHIKIFFTLTLLVTSMLVQADIYKWVDKDGNTHYSQSAPDKSSKKMDLPSTSIKTKDREANKERVKDLQKFLKALDEDKQADKKMEQENNRRLQQAKDYEKYCKELRNELRDMEIGGVVWYELDGHGERRFFSDKEVKQKKQNLRDRVKNECEN